MTLEGEMTVYQAVALKHAIVSSLSPGPEGPEGPSPVRPRAIRVDLSRVTAIDGAGIQLLLLWQSLAHARGCTLALGPCSPVVRETLQLLRLEAAFGLDGGPSLDGTPWPGARPAGAATLVEERPRP